MAQRICRCVHFLCMCACVSVLGKTSALIGFVNQGFKRPLALLYFRDGGTLHPHHYWYYTDIVHNFSSASAHSVTKGAAIVIAAFSSPSLFLALYDAMFGY